MKNRRGVRGRATELAETVVAGVKRRQQARAPKVLLYDDAGRPRVLDPASPGAVALFATAQELVALGGPPEPDDAGADPLDGDE